MTNRSRVALLFGVLALAGCSSGGHVDQDTLCIADSDETASKCEAGKMFYFQPQRWGNEQLPLNVAAVYCDLNYQVVQNNGGVVCVFTDKRLHLLAQKN